MWARASCVCFIFGSRALGRRVTESLSKLGGKPGDEVSCGGSRVIVSAPTLRFARGSKENFSFLLGIRSDRSFYLRMGLTPRFSLSFPLLRIISRDSMKRMWSISNLTSEVS